EESVNCRPRPAATSALSAQRGRPPKVRRDSWAVAGATPRSARARTAFTSISVIRAPAGPRLGAGLTGPPHEHGLVDDPVHAPAVREPGLSHQSQQPRNRHREITRHGFEHSHRVWGVQLLDHEFQLVMRRAVPGPFLTQLIHIPAAAPLAV